jgi:NTP pyrophosphatase (non-canonical NTP hydrolase)
VKFDDVSKPNRARLKRWHRNAEGWSCGDTSNGMVGEAGEAANIVKKIRRIETGIVEDPDGSKRSAFVADLADELADVFLYLDLLADEFNINLPHAIRRKFNRVSRELGFPEQIGALHKRKARR